MPFSQRSTMDQLSYWNEFERVKEISRGQGICNNGIYLIRRRRDDARFVLKSVGISEIAEAEKEALSYLRSHDSIVKLIDAFVAPTRPQTMAFIMEYCDYGSLHSLINRINRHNYRLPEHFIWHAFCSLSCGLAYMHYGITDYRSSRPAHWRRIVHRDIRPANILLKSDRHHRYPRVLIADFGLAHMSGLTYHPQFNGERERFSGRGDVWMLGCAMVDLILGTSGMTPIPPELGQDCRDCWAPSGEISSGLNLALEACLTIDNKKRVSSKDLMLGLVEMRQGERPKRERLPEWIWG
ncbi:hypothetical protein GP486_002362 [Trichoglossum hirsutum]|uniref:EKC/KEOPS complex subunit BUD32 n=1 Tax=Trichoglossum hirsutum TaxID=265104 RepID=A0A9P8LEX0_9PEZI|nr:hypothetical protein GP486_002362 [Trichoglossum hirsutum]